MKSLEKYKLCILDRDGVINKVPKEPNRYILSPEDLILDHSFLAKLKNFTAGTKFCIATNQQAVGLEILTLEELNVIHGVIREKFYDLELNLTKIYICPHRVIENCNCRKPKPGMILRAMRDHGVNGSETVFIGDQLSDFECSQLANIDFLYAVDVIN
jgi:D-glycero-D-manno-heptose 1,7-bisphosphate phosphatase